MGQKIDNNIANIDAKAMSMTSGIGQGFGVSPFSDGKVKTEDGSIGSVKYDKGNNPYSEKGIDNFEEYLRSKNEKAKANGEDEEAKEKEAKESEKEIMRNLSSEELRQLSMMGIDVEGAALSDIMGVVNSMRGDAHREEMAQLMAKVSAGDDPGDMTVQGGKVFVSGMDVELSNVSVLDVNNEKRIEDGESFIFNREDLLHIIKNNLAFNEENIYKAHFSGMKVEEATDTAVVTAMEKQLQGIFEQSGYGFDSEAMDIAKMFLSNDVPVTTDNVSRYMEYKKYIGMDVQAEEVANEIKDISENRLVEEKANQLLQDVISISDDAVMDMEREGKIITIAAAKKYSVNYERKENITETTLTEDNVTAKRQLEEIRYRMTLQAANRLVRKDFNIETRELGEVVKALRQQEEAMIGHSLKAAGLEVSKENISVYQNLKEEITNLSSMHAKVLAAPLLGERFSVNGLKNTLDNGEIQQSVVSPDRAGAFETVRRSYEAVGTAPRYDMGDSINKAFSNIEDILQDMGIDADYENVRAVKILGYNSLEITNENIENVVFYDRQVNDLIDTFYPEAVLGMIKDGINPLDYDISELNEIIRNKNYNNGVTEADNFATYLRDMENLGEVTSKERESYIGIYRAMNKLAKSGDREAGWVFANKSRLTVRNLISAMRSKRAAGIDTSIGEDFGMLEQLTEKSKAIDTQIESAFDLRRENVIKEQFEEAIEDERIKEFVKANEIEESMVNYAAVNQMLARPEGIQGLVTSLLENMSFDDGFKDKEIDKETENIADSINGEDIDINPMDALSMEGILKLLGESEDGSTISKQYDSINDLVIERMYSTAETTDVDRLNLASIKLASAGLNILGNMAREEKYQIPVETNDGVKLMNLSLRHGTNERKIQIDISDERIGGLTATISFADENALSGNIVSQTADGNNLLIQRIADIRSAIEAEGYDASMVSIGTLTDSVSVNEDINVSGRDMYKAAVSLVKALNIF